MKVFSLSHFSCCGGEKEKGGSKKQARVHVGQIYITVLDKLLYLQLFVV